jgi:hypothetical protein
MSPETHALIGAALLLANLAAGVWALVEARRTPKPSGGLRAAVLVAFALLVVQVLVGLDLWARGLRPMFNALDFVHIGGPILALLGAVYHLFVSTRNQTRNYAVASLMTFALGLISYAIGEMGG